MIQKIAPFLWFNDQAEEAANYYVSIFKNSRIVRTSHYSETGPGKPGSVMTISFLLEGQEFCALNGGLQFTFSPAISFVVNCDTQAEIDYYWEKLSGDGGREVQCGWLQDKFGLSWQIVPAILPELVSDDPIVSNRVMQAVMKMVKLDIVELKKARAGK